MRLTTELPRQRTPWQARLLGAALGLLGPVVLGLSIGVPARGVPGARAADERIVALDLPLTPAIPVVEGATPTRDATPVAPTTPDRERAPSGVMAGPVMPSVTRNDSSGSGDSAASARARSATVPTSRDLFAAPAAGRPLCLPPCGGSGATIAAGANGRAGATIVFPPMSREERDSIARAVITAAAAAGGAESHPSSAMPANAIGMSIPVGLPGGGPTRAQRERARVLDADVSTRLARIRARADSIAALRRRDSVARAMPRADERATAPGA